MNEIIFGIYGLLVYWQQQTYKQMYKIIISVFLLGMCTVSVYSSTNKLNVGNFSQMDLSGWDEKSFAGSTNYEIYNDSQHSYLRASANGTASALFKKVKVDLNETPYLNWSWRIEKSLASVDEQTKQGDDYAARIYVILKRGIAPWKTNALNYVWSSNSQPPMSWPNAYTDKAIMIPLRTQQDDGLWKIEKVNIKEDFKKFFGLEIDHIHAVALMTDTDNSQLQAIASYGDIFFTAN